MQSWKSNGAISTNTVLGSLEDDDGRPYDQFKGKNTTYRDDVYTTKIDNSKITDELKKKATKVERELLA